ncbi:sortase [Kribbella sp. NPDC026596]|uniref:sortase domain-containing protein n=1 Tax=Kribbella sp. NPDC026596 TaxID=3155122 RepID=UPI0033C86FE4
MPSRHTSTFDDRPHRRPGQPPASIDTSCTAFAVELHTRACLPIPRLLRGTRHGSSLRRGIGRHTLSACEERHGDWGSFCWWRDWGCSGGWGGKDDLSRGIGHYPQTQLVETADAVYTYELYGSPRDLTVKPTDTWVLDPVPGNPRETPAKSTITLTTCQDLFHSPDRSVAFGHLVRVSKKS